MGCVAADIMKLYVDLWAERKGLTDKLQISLCSIWIEGMRRPCVRIWAHQQDLETIMMLEDEPLRRVPHPVAGSELTKHGTLDYYCTTGGYLRAPTKRAGLVKLYPVEINSADKATNAAKRYALSPNHE